MLVAEMQQVSKVDSLFVTVVSKTSFAYCSGCSRCRSPIKRGSSTSAVGFHTSKCQYYKTFSSLVTLWTNEQVFVVPAEAIAA
jgi:hypothetical protein